jgi:hypothetical protein
MFLLTLSASRSTLSELAVHHGGGDSEAVVLRISSSKGVPLAINGQLVGAATTAIEVAY